MIGQHLIIDIKECKNKLALDSIEKCIEIFDNVCTKYKLSVLNRAHHKFHPQGVSLIYLLSESHISMHSWPEMNLVSLDCYTCSDNITPKIHEQLANDLLEAFQGKKHRFVILDRGYKLNNDTSI